MTLLFTASSVGTRTYYLSKQRWVIGHTFLHADACFVSAGGLFSAVETEAARRLPAWLSAWASAVATAIVAIASSVTLVNRMIAPIIMRFGLPCAALASLPLYSIRLVHRNDTRKPRKVNLFKVFHDSNLTYLYKLCIIKIGDGRQSRVEVGAAPRAFINPDRMSVGSVGSS